MTTALQTLPLVHPRVLSLTRTHMKTVNTEELVITAILLIGDAIGFITTHLLVPGISLILAGLGWRPPTRPEVEPPFTTPEELHKAFAALTDPAMGVPWEDAIPATAPATLEELQRAFQEIALTRGCAAALEAFPLDTIPADDLADDYSREVPTAEERSPSVRRRSKR
jgi:hypothetical protein